MQRLQIFWGKSGALTEFGAFIDINLLFGMKFFYNMLGIHALSHCLLTSQFPFPLSISSANANKRDIRVLLYVRLKYAIAQTRKAVIL